MKHIIVYAETGNYAGWPANNGIWRWGDELLVGFTVGDYLVQPGHSIAEPYVTTLARSVDGGETWSVEIPDTFVRSPSRLQPVDAPLDFTAPGFAMRVVGTGYHGSGEPRGGFLVSTDRGRHWRGGYRFAGLADHPALGGLELTPRTDYLVNGARDCQIFLSARQPGNWASEKVFCARTTDGGLSFRLASWIVPRDDPNRAVMPATVRCSSARLVSALRRRDVAAGPDGKCWIDAYRSDDDGETWSFLARVTGTGPRNGNPPALVRLQDGRLCCVYGHRGRRTIEARFSDDDGTSWGEAQVLRHDYHADRHGMADLGYPRVVQRSDSRLVAIYYWATTELPHQHIAATIWVW